MQQLGDMQSQVRGTPVACMQLSASLRIAWVLGTQCRHELIAESHDSTDTGALL